MPKPEPSATSPLTAAEAQQKIAAFITESEDGARPEDAADQPNAGTPPAPADTPPGPPPPEPPATEPPPTEAPTDEYEVVVNGDTLRVDLDELKAGYQKHEDYKQKTMALAEERRHFEAESQSVQAERAQYATAIREFREALEQITGEPDWAEKRKTLPPEQFLQEKADWELTKAQTEKLKAEEQRIAERMDDDRRKQFQTFLRAEEDKLKAAIPEWADLDKGKAELAALKGFAKKQYGFDEAAINNGFTQAAIVLLVRDAKRYRDLQREPSPQAKSKVPAIRTARPGAAPPPPPPNAHQQKLIERLGQTHRQRDAVEAVKALLGDS